jgi:hypothetical protein
MNNNIVLFIVTTLACFCFPKMNFGQAPNLGTTSSFALFATNGGFSNSGSATIVTGDVGTNAGAFTAFPTGTVYGQIHVVDAASAQAANDVAAAYADLSGVACGSVLGTPFGSGQILTSGVYCQGSASLLNGTLTLDGQGDPNALFIIKIGGALSTSTNSNVTLINAASANNVYWLIGGQFDLSDGSVFRGTVVADGAINILEAASLYGRALTQSGAISLHNTIVTAFPLSAGIITGTASVCQTQMGVNYSVSPITNATGYVWALPPGATISSGSNTNAITVDYSAAAIDGNITVQGTNESGFGIVSANYSITVTPVILTSAIYHY